MKPAMRIIKPETGNGLSVEADHSDDVNAHPLPPEMEGRPDAAELRAFIRTFHTIDNVEDRRAILKAVTQAAGVEP